MNENVSKAPGQAPDNSQTTPGQAPAQGGEQQMEQISSKATEYIYGDSETFASLMEMLKANKADPTTGVAQAGVMIIEKLEKDVGELDIDSLTAAGVAVMTSLLDLANKAGIIQEITPEIGAEAWSKALKIFMQKQPGRIDPQMLAQIAQEGGMQPPQQGGNQQPQPAPAAAPPQEQGLLG